MQQLDRAQELSSFWDDLVSAEGDLTRLLPMIVRRAAELVGDGGVLTVVSEDGTVLEPVAAYHRDRDVLNLMQEVLGSEPYPIGEGIAGRVAADGTPALLNGLDPAAMAELVRKPARAFAMLHPIRSLLIVPMLAAGELVGTLGVVRTDTIEPYGPEDVRAVEALAERAALAIADSTRQPSRLGLAELEAIYRHNPDGVLFSAPDGRVLAANPAACEILGLTEAEICRRGRAGLLIADDPATIAAVEERARTGRVRAEVPMVRGNGDVFIAELTSAIFTTHDGEPHACVLFRDVSEQVAQREQLEQYAHLLEEEAERDALTGLRNRRGFLVAGAEAWAIAGREGHELQVIFFDLDDLKLVNDTFGHRAGDDLIARFAVAVADETREADVSARLGGDEFVLLLYSATPAEARAVVDRIAEAFQTTGDGPDNTFSVGMASFVPGSGESLSHLLDRADREMYQAKVRRRFGPRSDSQ